MKLNLPKAWLINYESAKLQLGNDVLIIPYYSGPALSDFIYLYDPDKKIIYLESQVKNVNTNEILLLNIHPFVNSVFLPINILKSFGITFQHSDIKQLSSKDLIFIKTIIRKYII